MRVKGYVCLFVAVLVVAGLGCSLSPISSPSGSEPQEPPTVLPAEPLPTEPLPTVEIVLPTNEPPTEESPLGGLLADDFSDPGSGWEVGNYSGGTVGYEDGAYVVRATTDGGLMWGLAYQEFSDVVIDVDAMQVAGPANDNNGYGVLCRRVESGNFTEGYALMISGDGFYAILASVDPGEGDTEYDSLIDWSASSVIRQGTSENHLRAVCDGTRLALYVNDVLLGEANDSRYQSGDIALAAVTFESEATEVHFDNLVVTAP